MGKIMKYEFIKNKSRYLIMVAILAILEAIFLIVSRLSWKYSLGMSIALMIAAIGTVFVVVIEGIGMYNRDLRDKSGYMIFMTPLPAWQIIVGKILVILIVGTALFSAYCFLGYADLHVLMNAVQRDNAPGSMISAVAKAIENMYGTDTVITLVKMLGSTAAGVTFFVSMAYLSSTIGASLLRGKKYEKSLSFAIFVVFFILMEYISFKITNATNGFELSIGANGLSFYQAGDAARATASLALQLGFSAVAIGLSSYLLDKKVDL